MTGVPEELGDSVLRVTMLEMLFPICFMFSKDNSELPSKFSEFSEFRT